MATKKTQPSKPSRRGGVTKSMAATIKRIYERSAPLLICEAILFAVIAGILLFWPQPVLVMLTFVVGIALVVFGLYRTIAGFVVSNQSGGGWIDVIFGLINIVLGVLFCAFPVSSIISMALIFIVLFLFKAIKSLVFAINMARARVGHYVFDIVLSILLIGLAVLFLFYPMAAPVFAVYYLAMTLLLYAAADVFMYVELLRLKRAALSE